MLLQILIFDNLRRAPSSFITELIKWFLDSLEAGGADAEKIRCFNITSSSAWQDVIFRFQGLNQVEIM